MKGVNVSSEIVIQRPVTEVAAFACDPDNAPMWYVNIKSVEWETQPPLAVGSRIAFTAHFLGRRLSYLYEVVEWVPEQKMVMRTAGGPFPMETTYLWESVSPSETRMILRNSGRPSGFSFLLVPFMRRSIARENKKDLRRLKQVLESGRTTAEV